MSPVRTFEATDKPAVMKMLHSLSQFEPHEVVVAEELIDCYLKTGKKSGYHLLVSEVDSEIKGYICYGPTPLTKGTWDIYWIAVSPGSQGKGIGTELMNSAEENIRQASGYLIIIETSSRLVYAGARKFYKNLKYKLICRIQNFYSPGDDKLMLGKWFNY